jgi:transposase-like protein
LLCILSQPQFCQGLKVWKARCSISGLQKLNTKRTNNPINRWANKLNRQFSEEVQNINKYMKKFSKSLAIKEIIKKINNNKCWQEFSIYCIH